MRSKRQRKTILLKLLFAGCLLCISWLASAQSKNNIVSVQQLTDSIRSVVNADHVPGLMLGITTKDSVVFSGGFGYADIKAKQPVGGKTLFRLGSITKMFISLAILKLVMEGKLHLSDELKKIAPEIPFKNEWEATHPVRIVNLLEHTAGFDDMKLNRMCSQDTREYKGIEMALFQAHSLICRWKPGERFAYSNPDYAILGYIIEKLSGKAYDEYLAENILQPLQMQHSNFNLRSKLPALDTKQYVVHGGKIIEVPSVNVLMAPAGSLWSSSDEMIKMLQLFINNGQPLFDSSTIREMETRQSSLAAKAGLKSGYALANENLFLFKKSLWRGHTGLMGTCFSTFAYNRQLGVGFILSSNGNQQNTAIEKLVVDYLEQNTAGKKLDTMAVDIKRMASFEGHYQFANPRNEIIGFKDKLLNTATVRIENNELFIKPKLGNSINLVQTAPFQFAHKGANTASIIFTKNEEGKNVMMMDGGYYEQVPASRVAIPFYAAVVAVFFAVLSVFAGVISLIEFLMGKVKRDKLPIRLLPVLGVLLLSWAVINLLQVQSESYLLSELTNIDSRTIIVFAGTLLFGLFSILHLMLVIVKFNQFKNKLSAFYWLATAISICYISFILYQNGWIGLRTWAM